VLWCVVGVVLLLVWLNELVVLVDFGKKSLDLRSSNSMIVGVGEG